MNDIGSIYGQNLSMPKAPNLVRVVSLLYHRGFISIRGIIKECGVTEKTANRYISAIIASGIPIEFDKRRRGYRLIDRRHFSSGGLNIDEAIVLAVALKLLLQRVDGYYRPAVAELLAGVLAPYHIPFEDVWKAFESRVNFGPELKDISELITTLVLHSAAIENRQVQLNLKDTSGAARVVRISQPSLSFKGTWRVSSKDSKVAESIPVSQIWRASIV